MFTRARFTLGTKAAKGFLSQGHRNGGARMIASPSAGLIPTAEVRVAAISKVESELRLRRSERAIQGQCQ
jgi:hypothetical protein